jgi:hypothetical protein
MTPRPDPSTVSIKEQERPADSRPAWERIAYAWLAREVDGGQPVDPATLAREVSVAPDLAVTCCGCCAPTASTTLALPSCGRGWCGIGSSTPTCGGSWPVAGGLTPRSWRLR